MKQHFAIFYTSSWPKQDFSCGKVKNTIPCIYVTKGHNGEELFTTFYKRKLQKANQTGFKVENVIEKNRK